jgi:hypothetical protein
VEERWERWVGAGGGKSVVGICRPQDANRKYSAMAGIAEGGLAVQRAIQLIVS